MYRRERSTALPHRACYLMETYESYPTLGTTGMLYPSTPSARLTCPSLSLIAIHAISFFTRLSSTSVNEPANSCLALRIEDLV
jgi:hypothetical protein